MLSIGENYSNSIAGKISCMRARKQVESIYIIVEVQSGIPVEAKAFRYERSAIKHEKLLRKHMNLDNDETGIFEVKI